MTKDVAFVESCLAMALWRRDHAGRAVPRGMIHHSDAGSQCTSVRFTETLALEGLSASIGTVGDAYDNAVAESAFGLFKNEAVAAGSPFRAGPLRTLADVEALTVEYVDWYNNQRLHSLLGNVTPEEFEQAYYARQTGSPNRLAPPARADHQSATNQLERTPTQAQHPDPGLQPRSAHMSDKPPGSQPAHPHPHDGDNAPHPGDENQSLPIRGHTRCHAATPLSPDRRAAPAPWQPT